MYHKYHRLACHGGYQNGADRPLGLDNRSGRGLPWSQSANPVQRPDSVIFEVALRENLINDETLLVLNYVKDVSLRKDLGLKALGHRGTVLRYLQQKSFKYQTANANAPLQGMLLVLSCLSIC